MNLSRESILIIIQARINSTRFPGKVMAKILDKEIILILIYRLKKLNFKHHIIVAIPEGSENVQLRELLEKENIETFLGSENDVLDRYFKAAENRLENTLVRITADCPFIDPQIVNDCLQFFQRNELDYCRTSDKFPDGLDVEIFNKQTLVSIYKEAKNNFDREHVTSYVIKNPKFKIDFLHPSIPLPNIRLTVDEPLDLEVLKKVAQYFNHFDFLVNDIVSLYEKSPDIFSINSNYARNAGSSISTGEKLWKRAQNSIAGGNMLLSKNPEQFLKNGWGWPTYYTKTKGCFIWDLDNQKYTDLSLMGVGTNVLGYSHPYVDQQVMNSVRNGNLSTLNAPEEVLLAEKLIEIHPWANKAKFARTGGEINAVAIRLARASTGRDQVAFCGYHGWHDWYLAANLSNNSNLNSHLYTGLNSEGVPKILSNQSLPFSFNNIQELEQILNNNQIAAVIMEVMRNFQPKDNFLSQIRKLTKKHNTVLIFDECTSGFRENFGGLHKKFNVEPDLATFGKTLGNGYSITALIGTDAVMNAIEKTFISSTFWTERIGPTAAIATLKIMKEEDTATEILDIANYYRKSLYEISSNFDLKLKFYGLPSLTRISIEGFQDLTLKTFLTSYLLKHSYLVTNLFYTSISHKRNILDKYFLKLNQAFKELSKYDEDSLSAKLRNQIAKEGIKRYN